MRRITIVSMLFLFLFAATIPAGTLPVFPTGHPADAASGTFHDYFGDYDAYIWKESGEVWMEFAPLDESFICSFDFWIVQDDVWYDTVELETPSGTFFCDDVTQPYVVKLSQDNFYDELADLNRSFSLVHEEDGTDINSIYFDPDSAPENPPPVINPTTFTYFSPYFKSDGWTAVGLSNLSTDRAEIAAYVYASDGTVLSTDTRAIDPNGQTNFVIGSVLAEDGWVKIESTRKLAAMCLAGTEGNYNYMADIPMTKTLMTSLVVAHVAYGPVYDTTVFISNPNDSATAVQLTYVHPNGTAPYGPHTISIAPNGCEKAPLSHITSNNMINGGRVNITADKGITAFAIYSNLKSGGRSFAGLNVFSTE